MERKKIYFSEELMSWTQTYMDANSFVSRTKLSQDICKKMNWVSSYGKLREVDCRKEMKRLEQQGIMIFPSSREVSNFNKKGDYSKLNLTLTPVSCSLSEIGEVEIVMAETSEHKAIWRHIMETYHYLGRADLCGQQLRYLIKSSNYGWLGGLGFSSAAWSLECRDRFIGWTSAEKNSRLSQIVCNSRFLILPNVTVKNLASNVLSRVTKILASDWEKRYNVKLVLLETFVDKTLFTGTCYQAANWINVGTTKGRGRNDIAKRKDKTVKEIYLYPLTKHWQSQLCQREIERAPKITLDDSIEQEVAFAKLGDKRLWKLLTTIIGYFYASPGENIPQAFLGNKALVKAVYRFFDNKKVKMKKILQSHTIATCERIKEHKVVLAVQDTTELDYTTHTKTEDFGYINKNTVGLMVHDTMAFTEQGTPLGIVGMDVWRRDKDYYGKRAKRAKLPIEEKESNKWLKSYRVCDEIQQSCPDTMIVSIGDRESDIYEFFAEKERLKSKVEILVRSERTRNRQCEEGYIWDVLPLESEQTQMSVKIPRSGSRKARTAKVSVKAKHLNLLPPKLKPNLPQIPITCLYLKEIDYDNSVVKNPLEWMLYTTVELPDVESMLRVVNWYATRWSIEVYHKTLKSGCKIEDRQLGNSERIESCLAIDLIVAWRIFYLTKLGRETPELPCTVFFDESEWKALLFYHTKGKEVPTTPPTLKEAVLLVGKLGGHLGRKGDGMPGVKIMWRGLEKLDTILEMWLIIRRL